MCRAQEAEEAAEASGASEGAGSKCPCPCLYLKFKYRTQHFLGCMCCQAHCKVQLLFLRVLSMSAHGHAAVLAL